MLKKKMIASSIANLTDARYFAGWMVDYIVFNIDPSDEFYTDPQSIGTFQSWVEGPEYMLQMSKEQYAFAEKYLVDFNCQHILCPFAERAAIAHLDISTIYSIDWKEFLLVNDTLEVNTRLIIKGFENMNELEKGLKDSSVVASNIFLEINEQVIPENQLLSNSFAGYMVHGSPEEKVGLKSFDELDEIFELLQDF